MVPFHHLPDAALFHIQKHLNDFSMQELKDKIPIDKGNFHVFDMKFEKFEIDSYQNMYNAITRLKLWNFMKQNPPKNTGYLFWTAPEVRAISDAVSSDGHSGSSFAFCMRKMQYIAQHGWVKFKNEVLSGSD